MVRNVNANFLYFYHCNNTNCYKCLLLDFSLYCIEFEFDGIPHLVCPHVLLFVDAAAAAAIPYSKLLSYPGQSNTHGLCIFPLFIVKFC